MTDTNQDAGIAEETKKAFTEDVEVPIDKKVAGSTFSLVALSYMLILAFGAFALAAVMWMSGAGSDDDSENAVQNPPAIITTSPSLNLLQK
ncbi:hypothetical protein K227x_06110 [Rubripirellula lacrimiformis]|uniref:Uncharacterized protein n=1 Tax=Rubripirellula lacrimiformis TaxID=1930273 RepID=A0A517N5D4_9BACT|nr:hypothetical protein [Rubripirellula lacrimiformis]QDT02238.1 hypothetical protein K227x_06110 [Rubripirellula lacrimiformis]